MEDRAMITRFLLFGIFCFLFNLANCQKGITSLDIFLSGSFSFQSIDENDATNSYPIVNKSTRNSFISTYGFGSQIYFSLSKNLYSQIGIGAKYTSLDFWFNNVLSSDSKWYFFACEENTLIHLSIPLSIYYKTDRVNRFKINPGISVEPLLLIQHKSELTTRDEDLLGEIYNPESSPSKFIGVFSVNLKLRYEFINTSFLYTEIKLHNTYKYFKEEYGIYHFPIGLTLNLGYKFKTLK